jgi:5'-nucleotidase
MSAAAASSPLRILLTNDDGIHAPGLFALKRALDAAGHRVTVCAPDRPRSAASHAITLHKPLRISEVTLPDGTVGYAPSGTPSDCALMGLDEVAPGKIDLVVSGVNHGPNLGWDVIYSGTVAAAMEAVILGVPAIAVSTASYEPNLHYETAAAFVADTLAPAVGAHGLPPHVLLNVNVPNLPPDEIRGVQLTVMGARQYVDRLEKRLDPTGRPYYWLGGKIHDKETPSGTDSHAIGDGFISVTPIHLDMTAHALLPVLKAWAIET